MGEALVKCGSDKIVSLSDLKPHPKNRNNHTEEQIVRLAELFEYHGIRHPIIVSNLSGYIVAGHARLSAAKLLGLETFPVDYQDFASEEAEYAFLIADNAIALWAELDLAKINLDLPELGPDFNLDLLGIKGFVLDPAEADWAGMPEFNQDDQMAIRKIIVNFKTNADVEEFGKRIGQRFTDKTKVTWFPQQERADLLGTQYISEDEG